MATTSSLRAKKTTSDSSVATGIASNSPTYQFPLVRGIQAQKEFYTGMVPIRLLKKLFVFDYEELPPDQRAQRQINQRRVREIKDYILENPKDYTFSSATVMIDTDDMNFSPLGESLDIGILTVPLDAKFLLCDGQHRVNGAIAAHEEDPDLGDETLPVVFFLWTGLKRAQQVFSDLNDNASKPNKAITMLYDHRDPEANITRSLLKKIELFKRHTDLERTSLSIKSTKLFTINGIDEATDQLLRDCKLDYVKKIGVAQKYWNAVIGQMSEWQDVFSKKVLASEVRQNSIHGTSIALTAIGMFGASEVIPFTDAEWKLEALTLIDWSRENPAWEGLIIFNGKIDKTKKTAQALAAYIASKVTEIKHPDPVLTPEEKDSDKFREIKTYLEGRMFEIAVGVDRRSSHPDMPYEYHALLELEEQGICIKFTDDGRQANWKLVKKN